MTIVRLLILVTLIFNFVASTVIDDAKCDAQLEYFDQALSKHEKWAIEYDTKVEKIQGKHCMIFYRALENATEHESDRKFNWREMKKFNIPKLYLHRFLRVTPVLAILILIALSIMKFMGSGPYFNFFLFGTTVSQCQDYYWTALLHIQNYYNPRDVCISSSWYLSVDYQLVLLSPLILYPAYYFGWKFLWTLPTYIIGIQIWTFIAALENGYKPIRRFMTYEANQKSRDEFYFPTHIRCGPWLIGIILGYIFYKLKNRKISINKYLNTSMWILSIGTIVAILLGIFGLQSVEYSDNKIAHALFFALQRNSWGLAIAWIVFSCEMGYGSVIRKFLELPIWIPLGRMSLSFYLVHVLYFTLHVGSSRVPTNFDDFQMMHLFAGDIIVTTMLATLLWLTFEEPILLIENFIYKFIEQRRLKPSK
ncbi:hypothetical protein PVAND_008492 [Polypedilum vanderplanki]|uniref:Acyltransferase 3 domain-containing protein n=1 Tax=Polypedilum vanderplanki TaxID=319348 RepID=A0A9J6CAD7_POLVA|nr:hypothetical protein PVAND_008492 [Polypedilum vanderplanki]